MGRDPRLPRALRRLGRDPLRELRAQLAENDHRLALLRAQRAVWATRPPLLIVAGGSVDALRADVAPRVDVLASDELHAAAERANIDLADARAAEEPSLQGFISALRGTAGELHALDQLATGALPAPPGTEQVHLIEHTAPGVDLLFTDASGRAIDAANVKIAASPDIALRHFARHPDVRLVYAPSDTAARLEHIGYPRVPPDGTIPADGQVVVDLGQPTEVFDQQVRGALDGTVVDATTPLAALVPWFGLTAVAVRALRRMGSGATVADQRRLAAGDLGVTAAASAAGNLAAVGAGSGLVAVPFAIVGSWAAQAALATRRTWRTAAARQGELREALRKLDAG